MWRRCLERGRGAKGGKEGKREEGEVSRRECKKMKEKRKQNKSLVGKTGERVSNKRHKKFFTTSFSTIKNQLSRTFYKHNKCDNYKLKGN